MLKQGNTTGQEGGEKQSGIGAFFGRLAGDTRLLFRKRGRLEKEARGLMSDANSLIAKSDDYDYARTIYSRAIRSLLIAKRKSAKPSEETLELLAEAYFGIAICKKADGIAHADELRKAVGYANRALVLNKSNRGAGSTREYAGKLLKEC